MRIYFTYYYSLVIYYSYRCCTNRRLIQYYYMVSLRFCKVSLSGVEISASQLFSWSFVTLSLLLFVALNLPLFCLRIEIHNALLLFFKRFFFVGEFIVRTRSYGTKFRKNLTRCSECSQQLVFCLNCTLYLELPSINAYRVTYFA